MKRVMVVSVGGSTQPIINAIRLEKPDFVYFLCSGGEGPATSVRTLTEETPSGRPTRCGHCGKTTEPPRSRPILDEAELSVDRMQVETADPDDLADLLAKCEWIASDITRRFGSDDVEVIANYTGGTKTMGLALGLHAVRMATWRLQCNQATDGRSNLVKIESGDLPQLQDLSGLRVQDAVERARGHLERHEYEPAVEVLGFVAMREERLTKAQRAEVLALRTEAEMWATWDRFDHDGALAVVRRSPSLAERYERRLKEIRRSRELLDGDDAWHPNDVSGLALVEDLVENARRARARRRYDDAVGRLYRATELLAQLRLRRKFGLRTGDLDIDNPAIPDASRAWIEAERRPGRPVQVGLYAGYRLLEEMGDALGVYFKREERPLLDCLDARNASFFAHGLAPIDEARWRSIGERWTRWIGEAMASLPAEDRRGASVGGA